MIIPNKLNVGDTIGVVAPSNPIIDDNIEELERAIKIAKKDGFKVKRSKHLYENKCGYGNTPKEKAQDINDMFADEEVKMIWCAKGGFNSSSTFEYLDYNLIAKNPKILCGYSDINSISNMITQKSGIVTYWGANFKTIATDETDYSYKQFKKMLQQGSKKLGEEDDEYETICEGQAVGRLIGGNLSIVKSMVAGKYSLDFTDKILFLEEFGIETPPGLASSYLYFMKQNGVFDKIKGLWLGSYMNESNVPLEKLIEDVLDLPNEKYPFPIIKSNNFGHIEKKIVIPIGVKAKIETSKEHKIELIEPHVI